MHFVVIGLSQQTAPVAIREQVAVAPGDLPEALDSLHAAPIAEGFILSTCNRTEVYTLAGTPALALGAARGVLAGRSGGGWDGLVRYCYQHSDVAALRHLFRVACGLDSMVLGEGEILAQLRLALESARSAGLLAGVLGHVGAAALGCGKRVRSGTGIGRHALSIVSVALREAEQRLGAWDDRHVVVIGAGTTAELALKHLAALGRLRLTVVGRTGTRAHALAARFGAAPRSFADLGAVLGDADVIIACTAAPHHVVRADDLIAAGRDRGDRLLVCLDLGVPRDIEPVVASFPSVYLVDLDAVQDLAGRNRAVRMHEAQEAAALVEKELERFMIWWRARHVIPTIARVRAAADAVREGEVSRALARLPDLSPREQSVVRALASRLVGKLLHAPTAALREAGDPALAAAMRLLFAVRDDDRPHAMPNEELSPLVENGDSRARSAEPLVRT